MYRDLINAVRLCPEAIFLMDDVAPIDAASPILDYDAAIEAHQRLGPELWHCDVFRVMLGLRSFHPELAFCTIDGPDNPQALIWKKQAGADVKGASELDLRSIDAIEYSNVFSQGMPSYFLPATEDVAIGRALGGRLDRRSEVSDD
jgi:hypothetical protein